MPDYIGKICPFCKTAFTPDDDIVICSECEMPHHKDCWIENQGCTTFGCGGTIKNADCETNSVTATQMNYEDTGSAFCRNCGAQLNSTQAFCHRCGNSVQPEPQVNNYDYANTYSYAQSQPSMDEDTTLQQLIGPNHEYYRNNFWQMRQAYKKTSWNWPAFLVAPYWMFYRKMYGYGALTMGGILLINLLFYGSFLASVLLLTGYIILGIFANYIYMKYLDSKVAQAQAMSEPYRSQFIAQKGGVSTGAAILAAVGYTLISSLLLL